MKITSTLPAIIYIIVIPLLFLDVYGSDFTLMTYLNIDSRFLALYSIFILILLRLFIYKPLPLFISRINKFLILPITGIAGAILAIADYNTTANYVYSLTYINYSQLWMIFVFSGIIWLIDHTNHWFTMHYKRVLFAGAFVYLLVAYVVSLFPFYIFKILHHEDQLVENAQVLVLLIGTYFAWKSALIFHRLKNKIFMLIFAFSALALFAVAGDEISWGQRIFGLETPEKLAEVNRQGELGFHNIYFIDELVPIGYMLIGIYGMFAWIVSSSLKLKKKWHYFIPPWYLCGYFFLGFIYNLYAYTVAGHQVGDWSESAELMLYSGVIFTFLLTYLSLSPYTNSLTRDKK